MPGIPVSYDPASLGNLSNTLTPQGLQSLMEAAQKAQQDELARKTAEASAASQTAGQAYQTAAAAPPPQVDPLSQFVPTLLGHIASVIGQDKGYTQRAEAKVGDDRKALMDARLQNLAALRANSDRKASALEQAGHDEEAGKARMQTEKFDKLFLTLRDREAHRNRLDEIKATGTEQRSLETLRGKNDTTAAEAKTKADTAGYFDNEVKDAPGGGAYLDMTNIPNSYKIKDQALQYAKEKGLKVFDKDTATKMKAIDEVLRGIDQVSESMSSFLTPTMGLSNARTAAKNLGQAFLHSNVEIGSFGVSKELAIRTLSTLVSGAGSGVRITQPEVNMVNQNWPKLTDPLPIAQGKMAWQKRFLMNKVDVALGKPAKPDIRIGAYTNLPGGAQVNADGEVKVVRKSDGMSGWIMPNDTDMKLYKVVTDGK